MKIINGPQSISLYSRTVGSVVSGVNIIWHTCIWFKITGMNNVLQDFILASMFFFCRDYNRKYIQGSPFITLCLGSIELDCVISDPCYKGIFF